MSWAEVKKINSRFDIPVNHYTWMLDYKTYGQDSYVYQDSEVWHEFMQSRIAINDKATYLVSGHYFMDNNLDIGRLFAALSGINTAPFANVHTMADLNGNTEALQVIFDHNKASEIYLQICGKSPVTATSYDQTCFLIRAISNGRGYSYTSDNYTATDIYGARSGAKYVDLDGKEVVVSNAVNNAGHNVDCAGKTWEIKKVVKSFASLRADTRTSYRTPGGETITNFSYDTTFYYIDF